MKKPREDGTSTFRISGTKELLYQAIEIGQNDLMIIENEIVVGVLVDNLSFTQIGKKKQLTNTRIKRIYESAIMRLVSRLKVSKNRILENEELRKRVIELEKLVNEQDNIIKTHNKLTEILNSLPEETRQFLDTDIRKTNLSSRAGNALYSLNIITVYDLVSCGPKDVMNGRNIGKDTFQEIESFISSHNLKWKMFSQ